MDRRGWWGITALLLLGSAGCEGCLDLDEYELVPPGFDVSGGGGSGAGISVGGGGAGGMTAGCDVDAGEIYVSVPIDSSSGIGPCEDPLVAGARLYALDVVDGSCVAWATVETQGAADLQMRVRARHREDGVAHLVGAYDSGELTFPDSCADGSTVTLADPTPQRGIFVARLEREAGGFCTAWTRLATAASLPFSPTAMEVDDAGTVAVAGPLGNQTATFSSPTGSEEVTGAVFFAHYRVDGTLDELRAFAGGIGDDVKGIEAVAGDWLVAGALRREDPACHGCTGGTFVTDAASSCMGQGGMGGFGGAGGLGGAGGTAGAGGLGGAGGMGGGAATPNALNAFQWRWSGPGDACQALASYGADGDDTDAQASYDVDATLTAGVCTTVIAGQAGRATWRFGDSPATALFDAGGASSDGFIAQLSGADCGPGGQLDWATRLTASEGSTWGNRLAARRCGAGSVVTAFVDGAAAGELTAHRCTPDGTCDSNDVVQLGSGNRLVALALDDDGDLRWHGSFGPVDAGLQSLGGASLGEARDHLAADNRDRITLVFDATGPLQASNVDTSDCAFLSVNPQAGRYVVGLDPQGGTNGRAKCTFVVGLP